MFPLRVPHYPIIQQLIWCQVWGGIINAMNVELRTDLTITKKPVPGNGRMARAME